MPRRVSSDASVYGGADGEVAFLDIRPGRNLSGPPYVAHMVYMGPVYDVVTAATKYIHAQQLAEGVRRPRSEATLAEMLSVRQQSISKWMNAVSSPELTDEQWAILVKFVIECDERRLRAEELQRDAG